MAAAGVIFYVATSSEGTEIVIKSAKNACFATIATACSIIKIVMHTVLLIPYYARLPIYAKIFMSKTRLSAYDSIDKHKIEVSMREIALAARVENKKIIEFLQANIAPRLDFCKNIITNFCDNNFCYLLFACDDDFVCVCEELLRETIIDYIETVYKVEFLKDSIKANMPKMNDNLGFNAYVKVLSVFDKATDENALKDIILFNQTFFIDSFLEFRLNPLKQHWLNLASLSRDNITIFNSNTFVEVIRFLINTMDNTVHKLKVVCDGEKFKIYIMKSAHDKVKKIAECTNNLDLVTNVINSCPDYIDIYVRPAQENEAVSLLSNIFTNRLKIFSKNS